MKQRQQKSILLFIALSLLFHISIVAGLEIFRQMSVKKPQQTVVTLDLIEPPNVLKPNQVNAPDRQVVEQDEKPVNDETPEDSRFLSKNNQKVVKQTIAKNKGEFQNKNQKKAASHKSPTKPTMRDLTPQIDAFAIMQKQLQKEKKELESHDQGTSGQASQSQDYLKDVDQGLETMLSTKEFKYYTYFNRIRRQLSQYWEPKVKERLNKMFKQGRTIASNEDKVTRLIIFLNQSGELVKVQVLSESGVSDLDEAAIDAFRAAAPFPNPPQGIIDPDGTVKIRWDFVLES